MTGPVIGRRRLLTRGLGGLTALGLLGGRAFAQDPEDEGPAPAGNMLLTPVPTTPPPPGPRRLGFRHLHTNEELDVVYWQDGRYVWDAQQAINRLLRDFRSNEVHPIDVRLLDLLFTIHSITGSKEPYRIISAFRSVATNDMLRDQSGRANAGATQVAKKSQHSEGKAMDVRLVDVALTQLRDVALSLKGGGVGYYPDSDFVHVDVGPVRTWRGS